MLVEGNHWDPHPSPISGVYQHLNLPTGNRSGPFTLVLLLVTPVPTATCACPSQAQAGPGVRFPAIPPIFLTIHGELNLP